MGIKEKLRDALTNLREAIPFLDSNELAQVDPEVQDILEKVRAARIYRAKMPNSGGWGRLPLEMRSRVFEFSVADDSPMIHSTTPGTLSLVCNEWCREASYTHRLWRKLILRARSWSDFYAMLPHFRLWLSRTGVVPIYIDITFPSGNSAMAIETAYMAINEVMHHLFHCVYLVIRIFGRITVRQVLYHLQHLAPILTTFRIFRQQWGEDNDAGLAQPFAANLFAGRPTRLTDVTVPSLSLQWPAHHRHMSR